MYEQYSQYAPLVDTALMTALAVIVWAAYRELRKRKTDSDHTPQIN